MMPASDKAVSEYIRAEQKASSEIDFITYAIYAHEKYDWLGVFVAQHGREPSAEEIDHWITQITPYRFSVMRENAAKLFDDAARRHLAAEIETQKKQAVDSSIVAAVKSASAFWRQAALALLTAILAPLIIGAVIVFSRYYDLIFPTASSIARIAPPGSAPH
jgi:hypothetical protein